VSVTDDQDVLRAHGYHSLSVKQVVQETDDTKSFVLDIPEALRHTFEYRPGQFCTFRVRIGDEEHLRSYSMSSAPETDPDLTVTVKRVPDGLVSNWLLDRVSVGDVLETTRPAGVFCLRDSSAPVVAFCGGSGVTPVLSLTKSALVSTSRPVRVVYANRNRDSVIFADALEEIGRTYAHRLRVHHHLDSDSGFLVADAISGFVENPESDFYICGPGPFMDLVESTLLRIGVEQGHIFIERFVVGDNAAPTAPGPSVEQSIVPETVTVIMKGKRTAVPYQRGDTLLETARRGALRPPFSCEAGDCATCMAILREGSATMRVNNALAPEEVEEGWVLTCQALPVGATVTVEYETM
jgi:3-ketosteroid 9alpha-monooxygenase subunit B